MASFSSSTGRRAEKDLRLPSERSRDRRNGGGKPAHMNSFRLSRHRRSPVAACRREHEGAMATSMLVAEEFSRGARRSRWVNENLQAVDELLAVATPVDFTREDARVAGLIDAMLSVKGARIRRVDWGLAHHWGGGWSRQDDGAWSMVMATSTVNEQP
jgi:predicted nucleic acid-binding protein